MSEHSKKEQVQALREQGFVVVPGLVSPERCAALKARAVQQLREAAQPVEYEADLRYPGAPDSKHAPGGHTVRRLLDARSHRASPPRSSASVDRPMRSTSLEASSLSSRRTR